MSSIKEIYLFDTVNNVLRQRADMEKPEWNPEIWDVREDYNYAVDQYNDYLASLPAYTPVSGWVPEVGREYVEGKDFQVQNKYENDRCPECGHEEYEDEGFLGKGFRVCAICHQEWWLDVKYNSIYSKLAVPIEQKQVEGFSVKDMEIVERDLASVRKGAIIDKSKLYGVPVFSVPELGDLLSDISQILRSYKMDDSWSDWDESVLNRLTSLQMKILDNDYVDRSYAQSEVIQIANAAYDAGCGDVNGTEKEKYFKTKFNINIDDQGK